MGRAGKWRVRRLPSKLKSIRLGLGLSQSQLVQALGLEQEIYRSTISSYETGDREPPLPVILAYARLARIGTDALIDDTADFDASLIAPESIGE